MPPSVLTDLLAAVGELADLVLARTCAGCDEPGPRWCPACARELQGPVVVRRVGDLAVHAAAAYDGALREAVNGWKDHARTDLTPVLADALGGVLDVALTSSSARGRRPGPPADVALVPVPSSARSRRARGREPVRELALAVRPRRPVLPALRHTRVVGEQSGLDVVRRAQNLRGALAVAPGWAARVAGREVLVVDDVVTSGATLLEADRALRAGGARVVGAVTVAATPRRSG